MTESEFRIKHSELIEYYQLIEMRLKGICSAILADEERNWFERLSDYENDSFGCLLKKIKEIQKQKKIALIGDDEFSKLDDLRKTRNYWAHQCFGGSQPIVFKDDKVKRNDYAVKLVTDLDEAIECDEKLCEIWRNIKKSPL